MRLRCFLTRMIFILLVFPALAGCGGGGGGDGDSSGSDSSSAEETSAMRIAAADAEKAFLSGVPTNVLDILSDESKSFYEDDIDSIEPQMINFGNDFKNRKLVQATDNYAEYEFTSNNETFTVTFSRQEDGTWKLTRF